MDSFTYKDKVGITLTNRLVEALENGQIDDEQGALIAGYLQDRLSQIDDDGEASLFLTEVGEKWPIFEQLFVPNVIDIEPSDQTINNMEKAAEEQEQVQEAQDTAEMQKVEEALSNLQQDTPPADQQLPPQEGGQI
jgi:hypothetical protein